MPNVQAYPFLLVLAIGVVSIWDAASGQYVNTLMSHTDEMVTVAISMQTLVGHKRVWRCTCRKVSDRRDLWDRHAECSDIHTVLGHQVRLDPETHRWTADVELEMHFWTWLDVPCRKLYLLISRWTSCFMTIRSLRTQTH